MWYTDIKWMPANLAGEITTFANSSFMQHAIKNGHTIFQGDWSGICKSVPELHKDLLALDEHMELFWECVDDTEDKQIFLCAQPDAIVAVNGRKDWTTLAVWTSDRAFSAKVHGLAALHLHQPSETQQAWVITQDRDGLDLRALTMPPDGIVRTNYAAAVISDVDHIIADLHVDNPCGRIAVLHGAPGTGKTFLVRGMIGQAANNCLFVLVPQHMVARLGDPGFIELLFEHRADYVRKPMVLVLEDADSCLVPRGADNMPEIASLLNLTDGIVGRALNLRFIATTNAPRLELEPALLRPGRLCRRVSVGKLSAAEATRALSAIKKVQTEVNEEMTLAEVYQLAATGSPAVSITPRKPTRGFHV